MEDIFYITKSEVDLPDMELLLRTNGFTFDRLSNGEISALKVVAPGVHFGYDVVAGIKPNSDDLYERTALRVAEVYGEHWMCERMPLEGPGSLVLEDPEEKLLREYSPRSIWSFSFHGQTIGALGDLLRLIMLAYGGFAALEPWCDEEENPVGFFDVGHTHLIEPAFVERVRRSNERLGFLSD